MEKIKLTGNIHQLTAIPALADCPWPIADSHCSPCTIHPYDPNEPVLGFFVWGEYDGNPNRKRFHAQTSCVDVTNIKRLVFRASRMRSTAVPEGDGLVIGFVDEDTLNDPNKLYDPIQWEWAGYLDTLPGGTPTQHYYLCVDINQNFDPTKTWYLLMATNGSYETCGWEMSGFGDYDFPDGVLPLWQYNLNEPGQSDGWQTMDNYFRGCVIPYTSGEGATVEPDTHIETPNFPGTAQEGVPYNFSFTQMNPKAFPCGCPATVWYDIIDRDTGNPIMDKATFTLPCGYGGVDWPGTISFTGSGTFHGQIRAGHYIAGEYPIDDTHNFDVVVTDGVYPCSFWANSTDCEAHNCYWWNGICHDAAPSCEQLNNQSDCSRFGCYWYNNSCHSDPQPQNVIGSIDFDKSEFYTGPFNPNEKNKHIVTLAKKNTGTTRGNIHCAIYEYPDTPDEKLLNDFSDIQNPDETKTHRINTDIPNKPGEKWPLGVKVWGESESEPPWSGASCLIL